MTGVNINTTNKQYDVVKLTKTDVTFPENMPSKINLLITEHELITVYVNSS